MALAKITYTNDKEEVVKFSDAFALYTYVNHDRVYDVDIWDIRNGDCPWVFEKEI